MGLLKAYHIKEESDVEILCERLGYDSVEDPREIKVGNVLIAFFGDDAINDYGIISEEQFEAAFTDIREINNGFMAIDFNTNQGIMDNTFDIYESEQCMDQIEKESKWRKFRSKGKSFSNIQMKDFAEEFWIANRTVHITNAYL